MAEDSLKFQFATDGEGNYGYLGADDSFIPFKSGTLTKIATDVSFSDGSVDCTGIKGYENLTIDNFLLVATHTSSNATGVSKNQAGYTIYANGSNSIKKSYNQSTGILSITGGNSSGSNGGSSLMVYCNSNTSGDVYVYA